MIINLNDFNSYSSRSLAIDKQYLVNCDLYQHSYLRLHTGRFNKTTISGTIKNVNSTINTVSIIYKNVIFENCTFNEESWFDMSKFINCKFINCNFSGKMRWLTFDKCKFVDTNFNIEYIRGVTIKKNCEVKNLNIKIKQIDEYVWLFGIRYKKAYHPLYGAVNINL